MAHYLFLVLCLLAAPWVGTEAGDRFGAIVVNSLPEEIFSIEFTLVTDHEPRRSSSLVFLQPEATYRLGVQGAREPTRVVVELASKRYVFAPLVDFSNYEQMNLDISHVDGKPRLRQYRDGEIIAEAVGEEYDYLTAQNRPNAVALDDIAEATDMAELRELVEEAIRTTSEEEGELEYRDLEAGPIWNQDHARERCPEVVAMWNETSERKGRWTGHWTTTVPGEMSVCQCLVGAAGVDGTLFSENDPDYGPLLWFPVKWERMTGVCRAAEYPDAGKVAFSLRFAMPAGDEEYLETLDQALTELRLDIRADYQPLRMEVDKSGDSEEMQFAETGDDKWDAQEKIVAAIGEARENMVFRSASVLLVTEETFAKAAEGAETDPAPAVMVVASPGVLEVTFVPGYQLY